MEIVNASAETIVCNLVSVEPNIHQTPANLNQRVKLVSAKEAMNHADVNVLLVDHSEFKLDNHITSSHLVDTRGIW